MDSLIRSSVLSDEFTMWIACSMEKLIYNVPQYMKYTVLSMSIGESLYLLGICLRKEATTLEVYSQ